MPVATGVSSPVAEPIPATAVLLLAHVPPPASVSVTGDPTQTFVGPEMDDGDEMTLSVVVATQPAGVV